MYKSGRKDKDKYELSQINYELIANQRIKKAGILYYVIARRGDNGEHRRAQTTRRKEIIPKNYVHLQSEL